MLQALTTDRNFEPLRNFKLLLYTYNALHGLAPDYLTNRSINLSAPSVPQGPSICLFQEPPPMATDPLRVYPLGFGTNSPIS